MFLHYEELLEFAAGHPTLRHLELELPDHLHSETDANQGMLSDTMLPSYFLNAKREAILRKPGLVISLTPRLCTVASGE